MDYAFAPGTTPYDTNMKRLFRRRPNTTLIDVRTVRHVAAFLNHLDTTASIPKPASMSDRRPYRSDRGPKRGLLSPTRARRVSKKLTAVSGTPSPRLMAGKKG